MGKPLPALLPHPPPPTTPQPQHLPPNPRPIPSNRSASTPTLAAGQFRVEADIAEPGLIIGAQLEGNVAAHQNIKPKNKHAYGRNTPKESRRNTHTWYTWHLDQEEYDDPSSAADKNEN